MSTAPRISICIPAYDMGGQGAAYLAQSLDRIAAQDLTDFEVVVSDQSDSPGVADTCAAYAERFALRRVEFAQGPRQSSANANNAMRHATGGIVKILFQDDLLHGDQALRLTAQAFDAGADWMICGSATTPDGQAVDKPMVPRLHPQIRFGKNTVSSPSVLAMRRDRALAFDENLIWLMDVEMYHRLAKTRGSPAIVPQTLILNRLHPGQVSASVAPDLRRRELTYVREKHKAGETFADRLAYLKQVLKAR